MSAQSNSQGDTWSTVWPAECPVMPPELAVTNAWSIMYHGHRLNDDAASHLAMAVAETQSMFDEHRNGLQSIFLVLCETIDRQISNRTRRSALDYLIEHTPYGVGVIEKGDDLHDLFLANRQEFASHHGFAVHDVAAFLLVKGGSG